MEAKDAVGLALVAGLITFLVGASAWRLDYEKPISEALRVIHSDRRRRAWIHLWMLPAMFITAAGLVGYAALPDHGDLAAVLSLMASTVYAMGATCWVVALAFRLTVVPWAAEQAVLREEPPPGFVAFDRWATSLYVVHMTAAYAAFALLGSATLMTDVVPPWTGWLAVGWGLLFSRDSLRLDLSDRSNPPFWAHAYTGVVGVMLLLR